MRSPPCKKPTRGRRRLPRRPWPARPPSRRHGEQTGRVGRKAVRGVQPAFRASSPLSVIQGGPALRKHPPQIQTRSGIFFPQRGLFLRVPDTGPPGADAAGGRASGALFPPGHGEPREGPSGPACHPSAARGGHIVSVRRDLRTCSAPLPAVQAPVMSVPVLRWVPLEGGTPRSPGLGRRLGLWLGPWQPSEDLPLPLGGAASMGGRPRPRALRGLLPRARAAPGHGLAGAGRPPAFPVWSARRGGWWTPRGCAGLRVPEFSHPAVCTGLPRRDLRACPQVCRCSVSSCSAPLSRVPTSTCPEQRPADWAEVGFCSVCISAFQQTPTATKISGQY